MAEYELGIKLREIYDNAPKGDIAVNIHLFGIKYANEIRNNNYKSVNIVKASGLPNSYHTEIDKGIKLAKYVELKNATPDEYPAQDKNIKERVAALDKFFASVDEANDEEVPEFERVKFTREVDL